MGTATAEAIITVIQVRNYSGSDQSSSSGGSKKWSDFLSILKTELKEFVDGSDVNIREVNDYNIFRMQLAFIERRTALWEDGYL